MLFKNVGSTTKTFFGVEIKPGEIKDVEGYINAKHFIRVDRKPQTKSAVSNNAEDKSADKQEDKSNSKTETKSATEVKVEDTKKSEKK